MVEGEKLEDDFYGEGEESFLREGCQDTTFMDQVFNWISAQFLCFGENFRLENNDLISSTVAPA